MTNLSLPNEIWKPVIGFESRFQISNFGRLLSTYRISGNSVIIVPKPNKKGYIVTCLRDREKHRRTFMHRLVAEHFLVKPITTEIIEIDHKDCNRQNNHVSNLRWLTHAEHKKVTSEKGEFPRGSDNHMSKLTEEQVIEARRIYENGGVTQKSLAEAFHISKQQMNDILNRKAWVWL